MSDWGAHCVYHCFGEEVGANGTPHLQGYVYMRNACSMGRLRDVLPGGHFEVARGTPVQNRDYCSKDGIFTEEGALPAQGARTDLNALKSDLDSGAALAVVAENHFGSFLRYQRGIHQYRLLKTPVRDWPMEVEVYWGPSGTGKSRICHEKYPGAFWKPAGPWWDGYDGQQTVVLDEFYGNQLAHTELLRLLDRYPFQVPIKGGFVNFCSLRVCFTSNVHPRDWYGPDVWHAESWEASPLARRLHGCLFDSNSIGLWIRSRRPAPEAPPEGDREAILAEPTEEQPAGLIPVCIYCERSLSLQGDCVYCHL